MWKYLSHLLAFVTCKTTACIFSVLFHFVWQKKAFLFRKLDFTGYLQPSLAVTISLWCVIRWICIEKKMIYYSSIFTFTFIASFRTNLETVCAHNIYILFIAKSNCSLWLCIFSMLGLKTYHFCLYYLYKTCNFNHDIFEVVITPEIYRLYLHSWSFGKSRVQRSILINSNSTKNSTVQLIKMWKLTSVIMAWKCIAAECRKKST